MATERLNRYISLAAGVSRRVADEMVRGGRVTLGGAPVLDPGTLWDPATQEVRLDGRTLVPIQEEKIYIMLYKPDNVVTTMKDSTRKPGSWTWTSSSRRVRLSGIRS